MSEIEYDEDGVELVYREDVIEKVEDLDGASTLGLERLLKDRNCLAREANYWIDRTLASQRTCKRLAVAIVVAFIAGVVVGCLI